MKTKFDVWCLSITGILFALYLINVLLGKAALVFDFDPILEIGDVGEFLILFAAVICFVIEVLRRERMSAKPTKTVDTAEEETK